MNYLSAPPFPQEGDKESHTEVLELVSVLFHSGQLRNSYHYSIAMEPQRMAESGLRSSAGEQCSPLRQNPS